MTPSEKRYREAVRNLIDVCARIQLNGRTHDLEQEFNQASRDLRDLVIGPPEPYGELVRQIENALPGTLADLTAILGVSRNDVSKRLNDLKKRGSVYNDNRVWRKNRRSS